MAKTIHVDIVSAEGEIFAGQAEIEVLAEGPVLDHLRKVAIGRCDQPHITRTLTL